MKKSARNFMATLLIFGALWILLTLYSQYYVNSKSMRVGSSQGLQALILYNPDPFYNFDEQICHSFAEGLQEEGFASLISTTKVTDTNPDTDLYVFCANTYNWAPDWGIQRAIRRYDLRGRDVVAITLGAGSTDAAQRKLEELLSAEGARLLSSTSYWLMRPNDENYREENNVEVALKRAEKMGIEVGHKLRINKRSNINQGAVSAYSEREMQK